jgi:hypothetical protein
MTLRTVLIILFVLVLVAHFGGIHWHYTGGVGLILIVLLVLVLLGVL